MARTKKSVAPVRAARLTLAEVKEKPGKYVVVSYRGYESGGIIVSPPDAYEAGLPQGYTPKDIVIEPWIWKVIPAFWLDDGRFAQLYDSIPGIFVDRVDQVPDKQDLLTLPEEIAKRETLTRERVQKAWWIATQPYYPDARTGDPRRATADLIQMSNMETTKDGPDQVAFLQEDLAPILEAALYFESRLGGRQNLMDDIENRLEEIGKKKTYRRQPRQRTIYT